MVFKKEIVKKKLYRITETKTTMPKNDVYFASKGRDLEGVYDMAAKIQDLPQCCVELKPEPLRFQIFVGIIFTGIHAGNRIPNIAILPFHLCDLLAVVQWGTPNTIIFLTRCIIGEN